MDKDALNLAKAIRRAETGTSTDPYNTKGASGEFGAYQFMPDTWKQWSKQYLGQENAPYTVANQNKVAYSRVKELKDQGLSPAEIASTWNSGSSTAYKEGKVGTNNMGVNYDVPSYVAKVSENYRMLRGNSPAEVQQAPEKQGPFKYEVTETPEERQQKIARYQQEGQAAQAESEKQNSFFGMAKNFGKAFGSTIAASEVGLGESLRKIYGNQSQTYLDTINRLQNTQVDVIKKIREMEAKGQDASKLKSLYNQNVEEINKLNQGLQTEELPTFGEVGGQLAGTALDLLTVGTYGPAAKTMTTGTLASTKLAAPTVVTVARKTSGLFSKAGAAKVASGAGIGYGYDIAMGLQGERGEDRTGAKAFIPGMGTLAGTVIPAALEGEQTVKNLFNKDLKKSNLITKRTKELQDVVNNNASLRKSSEKATSKGFNVVEDIANTDLLADSVDNTGTIRTNGSIDELNQIIKPAEDVIKKNLEKEGRKLPLTFIKKELKDAVMDSSLEGKALTEALKSVDSEIVGYAQRADKDSFITLAKIHDAKVNKYATINYMNPESGKGDKVIAKALKELVEKNTKAVDVKKLNNELSRFYNMQAFLEKLDGKKVKGGKLGRYFAQTVGGLVGSHFGPIGTIIGANVSGRIQGSALSRTLSGKTGQMPVRSSILEEAIIKGEPNPTINLPSASQTVNTKNTISPTNPTNPSARIPTTALNTNIAGASDTNVPMTVNNANKPNINSIIHQTLPQNPNKAKGVIPTHKKGIPNKEGGFIATGFKNEGNLTTKILKDLEGKTTVSKQYILDATNRGELKQVERDITRQVLDTMEGDIINVKEFADKVKSELLPLKVKTSPKTNKMANDGFRVAERGQKYENIALPDELRGNVKNYDERIYESPIKTSAGQTHFNGQTDNYFGHTRIEDMADNKTRRVIEVQSDLYQKGNLEKSVPFESKNLANESKRLEEIQSELYKIGDNTSPKAKKLNAEKAEIRKAIDARPDPKATNVAKLQQYSNPTAHFRMVREEVKKAAEDGKTKLQFPTGETAMKIEGLGDSKQWSVLNEKGITGDNLKPDMLKVGMPVTTHPFGIATSNDSWIITDVLGDGKFKAVTKRLADEAKVPLERSKFTDGWKAFDNKVFPTKDEATAYVNKYLEDASEQFDISGKVDTNNPIYKFYDKDLQKYLNKLGGKKVVDDKGVSWIEVPITKEMAEQAVEAFGKVKGNVLLMGAGATLAGALISNKLSKDK